MADASQPKKGSLRSTLLVSAGTLTSRVLALGREQLFAALLGAGLYADAFVVAFRIPNLLRDLFAEGALSAAFVPTFAATEKTSGLTDAFAVANKVLGAILLIVGALTLLGIVFARELVDILAAGFAATPGKAELTAELAQVMMGFLPLLSFAAVMMGMLNARGHFGTPALAPAVFNVVTILVGMGLHFFGASPKAAALGWAIGTLVGGLGQFLIQLPPLYAQGFRLRPRFTHLWGDPAIRRIGRLILPATLGLAATQVNIFINTHFASEEPGANAWLNYAFRLMYLPIGVFGVAVATVTASTLARRAAERDLAGVRQGMATGLRHVAFLTLPSTLGLFVLAEPIIALIYEHGNFHATDTQATARALAGYAVGLYAYSAVKVVAPAFYALDKPRLPVFASIAAVLTNLAINVFLHDRLGYVGLALGTSVGAVVNLGVLLVTFRQSTRGAGSTPGTFRHFLKVSLAALAMAAAVFLTMQGLDDLGMRGALVRVGVGVSVGVLVYVGACSVLRVAELGELIGALRRRVRRA